MRQALLSPGAQELSYEIRGIVRKAEELQALGLEIIWENIGDPIQKGNQVPDWIKEILSDLMLENESYGYCHSQGVLETRRYLANKTNQLGGAQITSEDILFFNGLGDAIAKVYQYIRPTSRVIGPSPAYSTHSSAEAAHANHQPLTYRLDPQNNWYPDMEDLYNKIKYNPNIVGILIINPDNPTGMVYPPEILKQFVAMAREFNLFLICDEIYINVTYRGAQVKALAQVIEEVPGIAMRGISKEFPWPGARCGWVEFYNRREDADFDQLCKTLENAKMIEVCATKLPQLALPRIKSDPRYFPYRESENQKIGRRSELMEEIFQTVPHIHFNKTYGAFYNTIIFKEGALKPQQSLKISNPAVQKTLETWFAQENNLALDKRFVYYLLAQQGICVVPVSSFCSELSGFRITLLEENEARLRQNFRHIALAIEEYVNS